MRSLEAIKRELESLEESLDQVNLKLKDPSNETEYAARLQVRANLTERINTLKWVLDK